MPALEVDVQDTTGAGDAGRSGRDCRFWKSKSEDIQLVLEKNNDVDNALSLTPHINKERFLNGGSLKKGVVFMLRSRALQTCLWSVGINTLTFC